MNHILKLAILAFGLVCTKPAMAADEQYPEGYQGMVKAAAELLLQQNREAEVDAAIQKAGDEYPGFRKDGWLFRGHVKSNLGRPGFNWNSDEGKAWSEIILQRLGPVKD